MKKDIDDIWYDEDEEMVEIATNEKEYEGQKQSNDIDKKQKHSLQIVFLSKVIRVFYQVS